MADCFTVLAVHKTEIPVLLKVLNHGLQIKYVNLLLLEDVCKVICFQNLKAKKMYSKIY